MTPQLLRYLAQDISKKRMITSKLKSPLKKLSNVLEPRKQKNPRRKREKRRIKKTRKRRSRTR
jgi:hypothetical protein